MKVLTYEAHNVLGIRDIKFDLDGHHLFLVGGANAQGKSSALTALICALAGKSGMKDYPGMLLRDGQKKGKVTVTLSGDSEVTGSPEAITVELSLRRKAGGTVVDENFRVLDSTGEEAPEPRTLLKKLFKLRAFDPLEFARMKPKEQATVVQDMLGLDLKQYDDKYKKVFEERTVLGREGKRLVAQLEASKKHEDAPDEEVKVTELMERLDGLSREQRDREDKYSELKAAESKVKAINDTIHELGAALKAALVSRDEKEEQIATLKEECEGLKDNTEAMSEVRQQLSQADELNRKFRDNEEHKKLEAEVKQSRGQYQKLTDQLADIRDERAEEVANAEWPVEGMELQEDGLLLNGMPFEQVSTSQKIMASVRVGMALNPKLRLLVCEHGSDLDNDTLDALQKVLEESEFQMLVELVSRTQEDEERCAVVIADGQVVSE